MSDWPSEGSARTRASEHKDSGPHGHASLLILQWFNISSSFAFSAVLCLILFMSVYHFTAGREVCTQKSLIVAVKPYLLPAVNATSRAFLSLVQAIH